MNDGRRMKDIMAPEAIDHLRRVFGSGDDMAPGGITLVAKDVELEADEMIVPLEVEREKFMQLLQEKERQHEVRRALEMDKEMEAVRRVVIIEGRSNSGKTFLKNVLTAASAAAERAGVCLSEIDFGRVCAAMLAQLADEAAAAICELADVASAAICAALEPLGQTLEEIAKLIEQDDDLLDQEQEDRHDGATMILTIWLPPVPSLKKLYGQGVDYGGLAHPSGTDPSRR